jgi:hypothetical protein
MRLNASSESNFNSKLLKCCIGTYCVSQNILARSDTTISRLCRYPSRHVAVVTGQSYLGPLGCSRLPLLSKNPTDVLINEKKTWLSLCHHYYPPYTSALVSHLKSFFCLHPNEIVFSCMHVAEFSSNLDLVVMIDTRPYCRLNALVSGWAFIKCRQGPSQSRKESVMNLGQTIGRR